MSNPSPVTCPSCHLIVEDPEREVQLFRNAKRVGAQHQKCWKQAQRDEYQKTGRLVTSLIMDASLACLRARGEVRQWGLDDEINDAVERLKVDVRRFDVEAWFGGAASSLQRASCDPRPILVYPRQPHSLQSTVDASKHAILHAKIQDISVTTQTTAGRVLIELEDQKARLTLITAEDEQAARMGIQGIDGTEDACRRLLNVVRENWRELRFEPGGKP